MFLFKRLYLVYLILTIPSSLFAWEYLTTVPKSGDGIFSLLRRYKLDTSSECLEEFKTLNAERLGKNNTLITGSTYLLPIYRIAFDGKSIRTTLGYDNYQHAKKIENYNKLVYQSGIKRHLYTQDLELWVPVPMMPQTSTAQSVDPDVNSFPIFGKDEQQIKLIDNKLQGAVYYVVSGHGGPDPGAQGKRGRVTMCEDEYAYDISLRLAKRLLEHGAKVYMIVRDPNDGIRDEALLKCDSDEYYYGGVPISTNTVTRLDKRAEIINNLYHQHKSTYATQQVIILHVDSRSYSKRIDIFYYYKSGNKKGKELATILYNTVKKKYDYHQPGRGYGGKVLTRDLHMLRNTEPTTVYIELGNIRNPLDQDRLVLENNRQAVANWLCEGIINAK